ncbi:MAG: aspartate aminotransferase family protein [Planctomycetes bacterium]|nr:aspartate aminotransferase family protein [Planctomycetota bacterium]
MGRAYDLTPVETEKIETKYRRIATKLPVPESLLTLERLRKYEPISMTGQPPVVWDHAEGINVFDKWGNKWLDWSSGVLVTNAGHANPKIVEAVIAQAKSHLLHNYCFASEIRSRLAEKLVELSDPSLDKVFLLTTGSEATENAIKLSRTYGVKVGGEKKIKMISFKRAFHGRTLGAQLIGGIPGGKKWIIELDPTFVQVDFPDGFRCEDTSFEYFLKQLDDQGVTPDQVAGLITEAYQGGGASLADVDCMRKIRDWCAENDIVFTSDEVQACFGRTGKLFCYEHYGIVPDLLCCGKGISSGLPLSAVIGKSKIMDLYGPSEMTSTHTGNPICCAAAMASIDYILDNGLVENAAKVGAVLQAGLDEIKARYPEVIGARHGVGLVAGLHMVKPGTTEPDGDLAFEICTRSFRKGLLMFSPVGVGGATVKIAPPLVITEDAVREGLDVLDAVIAESLAVLSEA